MESTNIVTPTTTAGPATHQVGYRTSEGSRSGSLSQSWKIWGKKVVTCPSGQMVLLLSSLLCEIDLIKSIANESDPLTAIVGPDPLVVAHLEGVEQGWDVDIAIFTLHSTEKRKREAIVSDITMTSRPLWRSMRHTCVFVIITIISIIHSPTDYRKPFGQSPFSFSFSQCSYVVCTITSCRFTKEEWSMRGGYKKCARVLAGGRGLTYTHTHTQISEANLKGKHFFFHSNLALGKGLSGIDEREEIANIHGRGETKESFFFRFSLHYTIVGSPSTVCDQ